MRRPFLQVKRRGETSLPTGWCACLWYVENICAEEVRDGEDAVLVESREHVIDACDVRPYVVV